MIPAAKATGQYVNSVLAKIEVSKAGYEEAILLDDRGMVCEGSGENLFVVKDGVIATPGFSADILGGINRASVITIARDLGYEVVERDVARGELYLADEIFMTGTAAELTPLREVDDRPVGTGEPGEITRTLAARVRRRAVRPLGPLRGVARHRRGARAHHVSRVTVYDCTLRDGMQGEGMSLSASEKLRVAHVLDQLGIPLIEAGFPSSNPKEAELFDLLAAETFAQRRDRRLRDDPPARRGRRGRRGAAAARGVVRPGDARSSARPGACTSRRSCASTATRTCG